MTQLIESIQNFDEAIQYIQETMPEYAETDRQKMEYIQGCVEIMSAHGFETSTDEIMIALDLGCD